jgi:hypothetical protein
VLQIIVSPTAGDPDLFVNIGSGSPATALLHDYVSMQLSGDESILVSANDPKYSASVCNPANAGGAPFCLITIGVLGFSSLPSSYMLVASAINAVLLLDGGTQLGYAMPAVYTQYVFDVRRSATVSSSAIMRCVEV